MNTYPVSRHENIWWSGGVAPCLLNLGTRWMRVVSFTPRPLYPLPRAPGTHSIGGRISLRVDLKRQRIEKSLLCPCRDSKPSRPARKLISVLTEPS